MSVPYSNYVDDAKFLGSTNLASVCDQDPQGYVAPSLSDSAQRQAELARDLFKYSAGQGSQQTWMLVRGDQRGLATQPFIQPTMELPWLGFALLFLEFKF